MDLTSVLNIFAKNLSQIPNNLEKTALGLLTILTTIDIALMVFKLEETNWIKFILNKIMKVGFIIFLIKNYSYILGEVRDGFIKVVNIALKNNSIEIEKPSKIMGDGLKYASKIMEAITMHPKTYVYVFAIVLVLLAFALISLQIILAWSEFYLLCGISIIFLPFGTLKMTENYYTNVFKTIVGCSLKLAMLHCMLVLFKLIFKDEELQITEMATFQDICMFTIIILILAYLITSVPNLVTSMLTGSPALSASEALKLGVGTAMGMVAGAKFANSIRKGTGNVAGKANDFLNNLRGNSFNTPATTSSTPNSNIKPLEFKGKN